MNLWNSFRGNMICLIVFLATTASLLTGCQTSRLKSFDKVQNGMEKDQVLEVAGSPNVSRRLKGQDSWTYLYRDAPGGTQSREVVFENGRVVYFGQRRTSKISAEEQDRLNEQANAVEAAQDEQDDQERDRELGIARSTRKAKNPKNVQKLDRLDRKIRNELYGTTDSLEEEKNKRAPVFEPLK